MNQEFDFEAEVHFDKNSGRQAPPCNGYRPALRYEDQSPETSWMIWPLQFFTEDGDVPDDQPAPWDCFARFYILDRELRESIHRSKIRPGVKFYITEGWRVIGTGVVTRLLSIAEPSKPERAQNKC